MRGAGGGCVTPQRGTHCAPQAAWTHCPSDVSQHPHERGSYPRLQRGKLRHGRLSYTKGPPLCPCIRLSPHQRGAGHPSPASELRKTKAGEGSVSRRLCPEGSAPPAPHAPHTQGGSPSVNEGQTVLAPRHSARTTQARPRPPSLPAHLPHRCPEQGPPAQTRSPHLGKQLAGGGLGAWPTTQLPQRLG